MRRLRTLALAFAIVVGDTLLPTIEAQASTVRVIDGDTISLAGKHMRLVGIDAPELRQACAAQDGTTWPCGGAARDVLAGLLAGQDVRCETAGRDRYKYLLSRCWRGDVDVGGWMVDRGFALAYRHYSNRYVAQEDRAQATGKGLWRTDFDPPWLWRTQHRGNQIAQMSTDEKIRDLQRQLDELKAQRQREAGAPAQGQPRTCCKRCTKGIPCGNTCIAANKTCRSPPGCAC